ncbi:MAG: TolC family protein [Chlamydiae bacterium]|nr:TolC family protein [Chlamydiota bacterium]
MLSLLLLLLVSLTSCSLAPKQDLPDISLPQEYSQQIPDGKEPIEQAEWWAQFHDPLLEELMQEALQKNFDLRSCVEYIKQARSALWAANAKLAPEVDAFALAAKVHPSQDLTKALIPENLPVEAAETSWKNFFLWGFDASWEIDLFGKNLQAKNEAKYTLQATQEHSRSTRIFILAETARIYTEIRGAQTRLQIAKQKEATFSALLELSQTLFRTGIGSGIAIDQIQAELHACRGRTPMIEDLLGQNMANLALLLGTTVQDIKQRLILPGRIPQALGKVPLGLPSDLLLRRPDIKEAEYGLYAAGCAVGSAKAGLFPSFSLTGILGGASRSFPNLFSSGQRFWFAFPTINWALFQGGKVLASIQNASAGHRLAAIQYEKTVLSALKEVETSLINYATNSLSCQELLQEGQAQKSFLRKSLQLCETGLAPKQTILRAYTDLFSTQENYLRAKEQAMKSLIALYKSLGGGWENLPPPPGNS